MGSAALGRHSWVGTAIAPVTIGAYGVGADSVITNGLGQDVKVRGAYQVIDHISPGAVAPAAGTPTPVGVGHSDHVHLCGEPIGHHYGFNVVPGGQNDTIQNSAASGEMAGIHVSESATKNRLVYNLLSGNTAMLSWNRLKPISLLSPSTDLSSTRC